MARPDDDIPLANLLIAGVTKGGTTSLFRYLAQHPQVCPSDIKEPRYFESLMVGDELKPREEYGRHFAHCRGERYRMDGSPGYCEGGRVVAEAVNRLLPGARVIVSLRDPVQRCWSWYRFLQGDGRIPKQLSFAAFIDRCEQVHREGVNVRSAKVPFGALGSGCYDTWLGPWMDLFGTRFRLLFFEDLTRHPEATAREVCEWLDLDADVCADFEFENANKTGRYRLRRLQRTAVSANRAGRQFFAAHPQVKRGLRGAYFRLNKVDDDAAPRMDSATRERLEEFYAPHNGRLAKLLTEAGRGGGPEWLFGPPARRPLAGSDVANGRP